MKRTNHGHIVTIASVAGTISVPCQVDYNASKFAAFAFDEGLRGEL
jgi:all-trans-retinol dehydrogenase (NAD+)